MKIIKEKEEDNLLFVLKSDNGEEISQARVDFVNFNENQRKRLDFPMEGDVCYIHSFMTIRSMRNQGYGRKLMQHLLDSIKGHFAYLIVCSIGEMSNDQLVEYYKSFGFEEHYKKDCYKDLPWLVINK